MTTPDRTVNVRARFKLAQRVHRVLNDLEGASSARIDDEVPTRLQDHEHRGDFLVQALDLRLRVGLLVGVSTESGTITELSERARALLDASPDTDAVVLVYDDEDLTSIIIEPFDRIGALTVPTGQPGEQTYSEGPAPLRSVLDDYLRLLNVNWQPTSVAVVAAGHDIESLAEEAAIAAIGERRRRDYRVPEKRSAQATLSDSDARWLSGVVVEIARGGEAEDLEPRLRERGGTA